MKIQCSWMDGLRFTAASGKHQVGMDARPPLGSDTALSPKQLLIASVCGCTGMDVAALLKKSRQPLERLEIEAEAEVSSGKTPAVFTRLDLKFQVTGLVEKEKLLEAIHLSQTQYCGVSAMLSRAVPIFYSVYLNGNLVGEGQAKFSSEQI